MQSNRTKSALNTDGAFVLSESDKQKEMERWARTLVHSGIITPQEANDLVAESFGPLGKYVADNDNNPDQDNSAWRSAISRGTIPIGTIPQDESGQSAGFGIGARIGDWMQTYSGRQYWPMDPRPDEVHIEDIAHSLSLQCRYAGHCIQFYSVAEHSVHIARWLDKHYGPVTAIHGLLHDATEAFCVDVPRPLKPSLTNYKAIEASNWVAIAKRFHLANELPAAVHEADNRIIADELVNLRPMAWHSQHNDPLGVSIGCWSPEAAEDEFLAEYVRLERKRGRA